MLKGIGERAAASMRRLMGVRLLYLHTRPITSPFLPWYGIVLTRYGMVWLVHDFLSSYKTYYMVWYGMVWYGGDL